MVSYREALAQMLKDERTPRIVDLLASKGELPFSSIRDLLKYDHNQQLARDLYTLEDLGMVNHSYRQHGQGEAYSFYFLTAFGGRIVELRKSLETIFQSTGKEPVEYLTA